MRAAIALGSNKGDLLAQMKKARDMLLPFHKGTSSAFLQSPLYRTVPVDCPAGSPDFYNAVIEMEWEEDGNSLWELTSDIEYFFGREASIVRNSPRPIDLDLLYVGNEVHESESLILPHPRMAERAFVLKPLCDIVPDRVLPGLNSTPVALLKKIETDPSSLILVTENW